ncbi:hypothetical protein HXX76_016292 [Chlamydomonas incerta]|uniref:Uncharacterized protein n=1 Tax=Chlamydomonas incerta TaxID=51695 RepID=A0A835SCC6_CHLIN|nr:hypothetical protein HXX76_016299 [Chlamydomonas incerta]KAG2422079.1 hypothetical protein HXX76_016292 [Chlamydomonas incerta]|eukprot:KAG2422072.1 hypothetical protein HXX76_016299 [Chlamydomonas incerta]
MSAQQHKQMRPTDLVPMAVVKVVAGVPACTTVTVGGKAIKFVKSQAVVNWPVLGILASWEDKTAASWGCTEKQLANVMDGE